MAQFLNPRTWIRPGFMISTDISLIPTAALNEMFASKDMYWAKPICEEYLRPMLKNSLNFGLYAENITEQSLSQDSQITVNNNPSPGMSTFIGFARCITDYTTFLYLTDVHVLPSYGGKGLGTWLIGCVQEVIEAIPHLRRSMLLTGDWKRAVPLYEKLMAMEVHEYKEGPNGKEGLAVMFGKGKE